MMLSLLLGVSALIATASADECPRSSLQAGIDSYVASLTSGYFAVPVSDNFVYSENFRPVSIQAGVHSKPIKVALQHHLLDTTACATYTEVVAHENDPPYVIGTQIRYTDGKASKIEALVTSKENGWLFDAKTTFNWASKENRAVIPKEKRDSRQTIQAIADAYLNKFSDPSVTIPIASPCERLEGKMHVAPNCIAGIPSPSGGAKGKDLMVDRRYVIDEDVGTVSVFLNFMSSMPDMHSFRVEDGKLKIVHTITVGSTSSLGKGKAGALGAKGAVPAGKTAATVAK